jgi:hypothetical protein
MGANVQPAIGCHCWLAQQCSQHSGGCHCWLVQQCLSLKNVIVQVISLVLLVFSSSASADDSTKLDRYLERLGLTDLRLVHQQQQLRSETNDAARTAKAKALSDLYAQRLLEAADNPQRFEEVIVRVRQLVAEHPTADSPQLQVMLLQAEYQRGEAKALQWVDNPGDNAARTEAREILARVRPAFEERRTLLQARLEELLNAADAIEESPAALPRGRRSEPATEQLNFDQEMNRVQAVLARTHFFEGWSGYFLGLVSDSTEQARPQWQAGEAAFARLLEISTESDKLELEPEHMGLESVWRSRALLGLAGTFTALGRDAPAAECFAALTHPDVPAAIRETSLYWRMLSLIAARRWQAARDLARTELTNLTPDRAAGRTPVCVLLVRTGWGRSDGLSEAAALARAGLEGLGRLKQFDVLGALLAKYRPEPQASDGFYALWGKGKLVFGEAEKSKEPADYQRAAQWFQQALALPESKDDLAAAAQCRYSLAWCDYRQERYPEAIRLFEQAAAQLKALGDDTAVQSAWMAFTSYQQLHAKTKDDKHQQAAIKALADLKRDYPDSDQARRADLVLAKMNVAESPEKAIATLSAVSPDSPNYLTARFELCVARHKQWSDAKSDAKAAAALAEQVRRDVETYLAAAPPSEASRRIRAALLGVDVALSAKEPDWTAAAAYLAKVKPSADKLDDSDSLAPEYRYRLLQLAQQRGSAAEVREHADFLATHAAGSSYELPALVIVARTADERLAAATSDKQQAERRAEAIAAYQRLVKLLGESPEEIAGKKNALVANSKLAQYEYDASEYSTAAKRLEAIVTAFPSDRTYLRRAGLAWMKTGGYRKALPHWNTLALGSPSASEAWYEAKYYQLVCLANTDPPAAEKAWRQFQLLHPEVKADRWKTPFADLARTTFAGK